MPAARLLTLTLALALALPDAGCIGRRKPPASRAGDGGGVITAPSESDQWRRQACRDAFDRVVTMLASDPDTAAAAEEYRRQGELRQEECRTRMTEDMFECVMSARSFERVLACDPAQTSETR